MGHSLQEVGHRHEQFHDVDLIVVVVLLGEVVQKEAAALPEMSRIVRAWNEDLQYYVNGCIDLRLNEIAGSEAARAEFLRSTSLAQDMVTAFGPGIPMQLLNDKRPAKSITFGGDFPSEDATKALTKLRQLVAP